jgi:NAD(P)-dependent dehydrogenase (short-subunit alcohol dehydrogenase family)
VRWTANDIPDLTGKRFVVTGVTSGLGASIALELARHGAAVVLAARSATKLEQTERRICAEVPAADLAPLVVDLSDLGSVRRAAARTSSLGSIDCLVNNAGVMATPYARTVDGFELQLATNHLGPFALTGLLLPQLAASGDGRVVSTSSVTHRVALRPPLGDPRTQTGRYSKWGSYAQSKLADLLFTFELDRRLRAADLPVRALAAHPGYSATGLMHSALGDPGQAGVVSRAIHAIFSVLGQPADQGALPTLMAATADLPGSTYVGPDGPLQMRGSPKIVTTSRGARDRTAQRRLWEISEEATGVHYP